jgi:hypothetical protein
MTQGRRTILTDTQALSRGGREALDAALGHLGEAARAAYWASVRKCYNAPYEEDGHRRRGQDLPGADLPCVAALPLAVLPEGLVVEQPAPL